MSGWLTRIAGRLLRGTADSHVSEQISEVFYKRSLFPDTAAFFDALLAVFPADEKISDADLGLLIRKLCGVWGAQRAQIDGELDAHIHFWARLSQQDPSPYICACHADALFCAGYVHEAIVAFTEALGRDAQVVEELGDELLGAAQSLDPEVHLAYKLAVLRARMATTADADDDAARELYSELLEEFSSDPKAVAQIRDVGLALDEAVRRGDMPRAMMLRRVDRDRS